MTEVLAGRYRILRPLGGGGFAQTFLAADQHLPGHPTCVVKQLNLTVRDPAAFKTAKRLFDQEARVLYRLGVHDQIPRLLAHFEQEGEFFLVQEFVDGQPLNQEWDEHPRLSELEGVKLLRDILQVLAFVHQQGVIHRDIKPSNLIRRTRDRKIVLIDFGAVKQVTSQLLDTNAHENYTIAIGSPGYMPMEQQLHQPHFSSDIYAVGMVGLQALTGIAPIGLPREPQTQEIDFAQLSDRLDLRPDLVAILQQMVQQDYRQRYQNALEALQALEPLATELDLEPMSLDGLAPMANPVESSGLDHPVVHSPDLSPTLPPQLEPTQVQPGSPTGTARTSAQPATQTTETHLSSRELRNRQALLNKVNHYWVKGVLETSLHDQVLIALGLEERSQAVASPWNLALESGQQRVKTLPEGTQIIAIFDDLGPGRTLLILGEPGSGKTTTLLQLTRDLLIRAEQDETHLVPVVLNLSSWTGENQSIAAWIVEELNTKYQVPKKIGQPWVENQQLLLLLDGLDEVRSQHRNACVTALNHFQQEYSAEMVVCSRIKDYEALSTRLNFQSAVYLRSLTPEQIHHYLNSLSTDLTGLRTLLEQDPALQELARSPLLLNIMVLAYQGVTAGSLPRSNTLEECRKQLFDRYIDRMLQRRGAGRPYSSTQTVHWLTWLAQQLIHSSQTIFLIERLDRNWLQPPWQIWSYILLSSTIVSVFFAWLVVLSSGFKQGLTSWLAVFLIYSASNSLMAWLMISLERRPSTPSTLRLQRGVNSLSTGLLTGVLFGFVAGVRTRLEVGLIAGGISGLIVALLDWFLGGDISLSYLVPIESLRWSWRNVRKYLLFGIVGSAPFGLLLGAVGILGTNPLHGMVLAMIGGTIMGILNGLRAGSEIETQVVPNQAVWRSARTSVIVAISISLGILVGVKLLSQFFVAPFSFGLFFALFVGLLMGGTACIVHLSLRLVFYGSGVMPWNYARFLDYAVDRILLQKVGGGYIFIHRLLMEHFAAMQPEKNLPEFATLDDHRHI